MTKRLFIDTMHPEEIRVALAEDNKLEKFEFEITSKASIKGNIYLAKVISVEPSLQAAFVDYGGGRHGFLGFSEIHPNYYQIPVSDQEEIARKLQEAEAAEQGSENEVREDAAEDDDDAIEEENENKISKIKHQLYKGYKIQEVIKKRQVMLVQVVKDERGNKGASLTTFIALSGRYCIFMPNTDRPCGISKKISAPNDRQKMKQVLESLNVPSGMCVVIRTAALNHTKQEIKKDFEYVLRIWEDIKAEAISSQAPCLIREDSDIVKRTLRDLYDKDVNEIVVSGEEGYKNVRAFMKKMLPGNVRKVKHYNDPSMSLFRKYGLNDQIQSMYSTRVDLPSGGYLIINTTEALVAIDVNSGRSAKDRSIAATAIRTNLEAAVEVARQCKLRDLGGIIVVDFIDMAEDKNNTLLERKLKEAFLDDRAKVQVSHVSIFGLIEISRQRLHSNLMETHRITCPYCSGVGSVWSTESMSVQIQRQIEEICTNTSVREIKLSVSHEAAIYLMNNKKYGFAEIERAKNCKILFNITPDLAYTEFKLEVVRYEPQPQQQVQDQHGAHEQAANKKQPQKKKKAESVEHSETQQKPAEKKPQQQRRKKPQRIAKKKQDKQPEENFEQQTGLEQQTGIVAQKEQATTNNAAEAIAEPEKTTIISEPSENTVKPQDVQTADKTKNNPIVEASLLELQKGISKAIDATINKELVDEKKSIEKSYSALIQKAVIASTEIEKHRQNALINEVDGMLKEKTVTRTKKGWWNKLIKKDNEEK